MAEIFGKIPERIERAKAQIMGEIERSESDLIKRLRSGENGLIAAIEKREKQLISAVKKSQKEAWASTIEELQVLRKVILILLPIALILGLIVGAVGAWSLKPTPKIDQGKIVVGQNGAEWIRVKDLPSSIRIR